MMAPAVIREEDKQPFAAFSPEGLRSEYEAGHRVKRHRPPDGGAPEVVEW
jgi:hypothetical protein